MTKKNADKLKEFIIRFMEDDVLALASQLAYSLIFSFFPFLIFIISFIGYSDVNSSDILTVLGYILPKNILELIESTVVRITTTKNTQMVYLSLIFTIWASSSGFHAVIKALNKAYNQKEHRTLFKIYAVSILCTLGITVIMVITILFLVFGGMLGGMLASNLGFSQEFNFIWDILRYVIMFVSTVFIFAAVYIYTPSVKLTWKEIIPGAVFSAAGIVVVSIGFAFYVNNFANYSIIYGSIGAAIVLLTWLFILSVITILGGEVNAVLFRYEEKVN
ncbi:YihY/virulence factor BrkB family protein [Clostridium sp. JNZ X4-2]